MNVCFGSEVRPRSFGCVVMVSAVLLILRFRLLLYSAGSGFSVVLSRQKLYVDMVVCISWLNS